LAWTRPCPRSDHATGAARALTSLTEELPNQSSLIARHFQGRRLGPARGLTASASHPSIPLGYQRVTSSTITGSCGVTAALQPLPALTTRVAVSSPARAPGVSFRSEPPPCSGSQIAARAGSSPVLRSRGVTARALVDLSPPSERAEVEDRQDGRLLLRGLGDRVVALEQGRSARSG
jgi:hypothetical protein